MSVELESDVRLAAALVALGFPGDHTRFNEDRPAALERWRSDRRFRGLATAVARGMGLRLVEVTVDGEVILVAEEGTPFTPVIDTLLPGNVLRDKRRRQVAVLALLGVVAEVFPTEDSLAEVDEARDVLPGDVVQLLLHRAEGLAREPLPPTQDPRETDLRRAYEVVREIQPSVPTKTGREGSLGLEGIVTHVLRTLSDHGLLRQSKTIERLSFRPTSRFAPHVQHLLDHEALEDALEGLREARMTSSTRGAEV